ncbi:MAG: hypothetical protein ACFFDF_09890 [Candidatus Odinarchaeota archaeon]
MDSPPEIDGNVTLIWIKSLDADNYSFFQSTDNFSEINENLTRLIDGYHNFIYKIENLGEGIFYFKVVAYNEYGFTASNSLKINIQYPPSQITLFNYTQEYCSDGSINLVWTNSTGADNYSVYTSNNFIDTLQNKGILVSEGILKNYFQIDNLTNGDYFFIVIAKNEVGQSISSCIRVKVRRTPSSFILTSDADHPDLNGNFELIWTNSEFAQNYTIFYSNYSKSKINKSVIILCEGFTPSFSWPTYRYSISNWKNGTYFFKVIAYNLYGNYSANCLEIKIEIPKDSVTNPNENDRNRFEINPRFLLILFLIILLGILIFIRTKYRRIIKVRG